MAKRKKGSRDDSSDSSDSSSSEDSAPSPPPKRARKESRQKPEKRKKKPVPHMVKEQMNDKHQRSGAGIVNLLARVDASSIEGFDPSELSLKTPSRSWYFQVYHGGKSHKTEVVNKLEITPKPWFVVGREYDNDIIIMEKKERITISRRHCVVCFLEDGRPALFDLNSTHGTFVNDMTSKLKNDGRIEGGSLRAIRPGNRILFGRCGYQYSLMYDGWEADEEERKKEELRARAESAKRGGRGRGRGGSYRTLAEINRKATQRKKIVEDQKKNFGVMMSADLSAVPSLG